MLRVRSALAGILGIHLALASSPAQPNRYLLDKGKGVEVCEAYERNLNSFYPAIPMDCEREVNAQFRDFSKPGWARIDASTGVISKIDDFLWKRDVNPITYVQRRDWSGWRGTKEQLAAAKRSYRIDREQRFLTGHLVSRVDIDNDGVLDNVYLDRACNAYGSLLLVLNDKGSDIEHSKTELVMRHPRRSDRGGGELRRLTPGEEEAPDLMKLGLVPVEDSLHHASYDVFRYKDVTYFDFWWRPRPSYKDGKPYLRYGPLRVFSVKGFRVEEVCAYEVVTGEK